MRRLLIATCVACVVAATPALAADIWRKAPPPAPPVGSWTGFYAGINAGGGIGVNSDAQDAAAASAQLGSNALWSARDKHASPGAVVGGQLGFNWQLPSRWLVGVETDWQWTSQKYGSGGCTPLPTQAFFAPGASGFGYCFSNQNRITDFGTTRARGGVLVGDSVWYATGGLAWGRVRDDFAFAGSGNPVVFPGLLQPGPFLSNGTTYDKYRLGWTLGAGVETKIDATWSAKLEYLHVDLGTVTQTLPIPINPAFNGAFSPGGAMAVRSTHITDNIVRVGLDYHFSPLGTAAVTSPGLLLKAPPPPVLGWSGVYAGFNVGGGIGVNTDAQTATLATPVFGANQLLDTGDKHASPGAVAGGQIGYNWQVFSRWLIGIEADWQWTSQQNLATVCAPPATTTGFFNFGASGFGYCLSNAARLTDFGTERLRAGALVGDTLWYATGGLAWGRVRDDFAFAASATPGVFVGPRAPGPLLSNGTTYDKYRLGWTLGAGVETKLDSRWSAKLEYLYVDLGTIAQSLAIPLNLAFDPSLASGSAMAQHRLHITDNIVRAGVNYRFF